MTHSSELNPRYQGRPLLLIYEQYALDAIGALPPEKQQLARTVVRRVFGGGPDWRATLRAMVQWPVGIDDEIRENWKQYQEAAARSPDPSVFGPEGFAMGFADEYWKRE